MSVAIKSAQGRGVLLATVLGSGMAFIDATAVNVALPALHESLHADLATLQWTLDAYLLFLGALLLVGGALGDRYGRRRVFLIGVIAFSAASVACGFAPNVHVLIAARAMQGVAAALLVPGSLSIVRASYRVEDQPTAIGAWSGLSGVTSVIGPIVGGWMITAWSWRAIFFLNVPLAIACIWVTLRHVPESRSERTGKLDFPGAVLATVGLGATVFALIEGPRGQHQQLAWGIGVLGVLALIAFVLTERRSNHAMLPLDVFRSRQFSGANLMTLGVYAALSGSLFLLTLQLQTVLGYSPLASGASFAPMTLLMLVLSPIAAKLGAKIGYQWPMVVGASVAGAGLVILSFATGSGSYVTRVLPGVIVLGLGLSAMVAPLTTSVLQSVSEERSGLASGVNNAVARIAGLLAIAVLPGAIGLHLGDRSGFEAGYQRGMWICACLCWLGAAVALFTVRPGRASTAA
ncbi:MAG: MFS transporter [Myxococcaceae bacterium]